jgi:hypothetical protein
MACFQGLYADQRTAQAARLVAPLLATADGPDSPANFWMAITADGNLGRRNRHTIEHVRHEKSLFPMSLRSRAAMSFFTSLVFSSCENTPTIWRMATRISSSLSSSHRPGRS